MKFAAIAFENAFKEKKEQPAPVVAIPPPVQAQPAQPQVVVINNTTSVPPQPVNQFQPQQQVRMPSVKLKNLVHVDDHSDHSF